MSYRDRDERSNNPSHSDLGYYGYAAYLARQMDDAGTVRCAYCTTPLTSENHSLDHTGGKHGKPEPHHTVAACVSCNSSAGNHEPEDHENLAERLAELGVDATAAARRVVAILRLPLPDRQSADVIRIAEEHFGARLQKERRWAAIRRGADPDTAGTGNTRARRLERAATGDDDSETPF